MKIPALSFTAKLHLLSWLLFRLAVIANVGSFLIFFLPFYRIYGNYLDRGTYWFNAVGIAISNQSPTALLNTVDWDTLGVCVFLGLIDVSITFAMGGSEIHINRGSYCLRYEYGFQLWW